MNEIDTDALARITAPFYGFYAGNDARIAPRFLLPRTR